MTGQPRWLSRNRMVLVQLPATRLTGGVGLAF